MFEKSEIYLISETKMTHSLENCCRKNNILKQHLAFIGRHVFHINPHFSHELLNELKYLFNIIFLVNERRF